MQLPTWTPEDPLVHIGSMSAQDKGDRGDSYEGHGLSVSTCPDAWEVIAKLGGRPWWTLTSSTAGGPRFLNLRQTPAAALADMVAWAVDKELAAPAFGYKLNWYDAEHEDMVFTTFDNPHLAQNEFDAMTEEYEGERRNAPKLERFAGWKLTQAGLQALARHCADLNETPTLSAILYCEYETNLDGVYWGDELDVPSFSAPRAVIFPGRLDSFKRVLQLDDSSRTTPPVVTTESLYAYIVNAANSGRPEGLQEAIRRDPDSSALTDLHKDLDGTVHYHVIDRAILMANSGRNFEAAMNGFVECARVLRVHGAPARHQHLGQGTEMSFLDSDWSITSSAEKLAQLMQDSIAAGIVDFSKRLTSAHARIGGLMPLSAAFKMGNSGAAQVLLEFGASLEDPLKDLGFNDILLCARSFGHPNSEAISAMVTAKLMQDKFGADGTTSDSDMSVVSRDRQRRQFGL